MKIRKFNEGSDHSDIENICQDFIDFGFELIKEEKLVTIPHLGFFDKKQMVYKLSIDISGDRPSNCVMSDPDHVSCKPEEWVEYFKKESDIFNFLSEEIDVLIYRLEEIDIFSHVYISKGDGKAQIVFQKWI